MPCPSSGPFGRVQIIFGQFQVVKIGPEKSDLVPSKTNLTGQNNFRRTQNQSALISNDVKSVVS